MAVTTARWLRRCVPPFLCEPLGCVPTAPLTRSPPPSASATDCWDRAACSVLPAPARARAHTQCSTHSRAVRVVAHRAPCSQSTSVPAPPPHGPWRDARAPASPADATSLRIGAGVQRSRPARAALPSACRSPCTAVRTSPHPAFARQVAHGRWCGTGPRWTLSSGGGVGCRPRNRGPRVAVVRPLHVRFMVQVPPLLCKA